MCDINLDVIKEFAVENMSSDNPVSVISKDLGIEVTNPWYDVTGRFQISDEKAEEVYGKELIDIFVIKAKDLIERESLNSVITRQGEAVKQDYFGQLADFLRNSCDLEHPSFNYTPLNDDCYSEFADYYWVRPKTDEACKKLRELAAKVYDDDCDDFYKEKINVGKWTCLKFWDGDLEYYTLDESMDVAQDFFKNFGYEIYIDLIKLLSK